MERLMDGLKGEQMDRWTDRQSDGQTSRVRTEGQKQSVHTPKKQTDSESDGQTDLQNNGKTDT